MIAPDLLHLKTTPIKLDINVKPGVLEYHRGSAEMKISREKHGLSMHSTAGKLEIDTFEARNSVIPTVFETVKQNAQKGKQVASEATATYAQQGKRAMEAPIGEELITQFVKEAQFKNVKTNVGLDFIPKAPAKFSYTPRDLSVQYEADRMQIDWHMNPQKFNYTPADVQITVAQKPRVDITYTGGFMYVPRSSDPNYKPIDVRA